MTPRDPKSAVPLRFAEVFRAELDLLRQQNSGHANGGGLRLELEEADRAIDAARSIPPPKDDAKWAARSPECLRARRTHRSPEPSSTSGSSATS